MAIQKTAESLGVDPDAVDAAITSLLKAKTARNVKKMPSPTGPVEATGREARTIHRLLGYTVDGDFLQNEDSPLDVDIVVIDETSMVDLDLFSHLMAAIPDTSHLMLVGDVDQLPSVGAGDVLR